MWQNESAPMKVLFTFAVLLVLSLCTYSQENSNDCPTSEIPAATKDANVWKRHFVGRVSVCLPAELLPVKLECYDGGCGLFKSPRFSFTVDFNLAAWRPSSERYLPSYKEEFTSVNGFEAWIWYFEENGKSKGSSGMKLKINGKGEYDFGIYFHSTQPGYHELAKKIFYSIRVLPRNYDFR
jgi:hypothetical protein